jgi:hypothetical protein
MDIYPRTLVSIYCYWGINYGKSHDFVVATNSTKTYQTA